MVIISISITTSTCIRIRQNADREGCYWQRWIAPSEICITVQIIRKPNPIVVSLLILNYSCFKKYMLPTADVKLPSLFVCSSANWGYKGMFRGGGGNLRVWTTESSITWRSGGSLTAAIVTYWVTCILAVLAVLGRNLGISSSQNVLSFLWFSSALPKNWANATESRSTSLFSGDRMYRWRYLTGYLKRPKSVNASLLWRISGEIQANQKRRNILIE